MVKLYLQWYLWASVVNTESFKCNYKMYKLPASSWLFQHFAGSFFLQFVRFCVMKWLFLTFWVVRSIPWCGWIFVSYNAYHTELCFSSCCNLVLRFWFVLDVTFETQFYLISTKAQRYHCKYNFTAATFILLPRVLFYCREIYFTAASFILAPRVLFYCREFYHTAASFILPPRVLFSPPRVLFSLLAVK